MLRRRAAKTAIASTARNGLPFLTTSRCTFFTQTRFLWRNDVKGTEDDPFFERSGWDNSGVGRIVEETDWTAVMEAIQSPELTKVAPDYASNTMRGNTVLGMAMRAVEQNEAEERARAAFMEAEGQDPQQGDGGKKSHEEISSSSSSSSAPEDNALSGTTARIAPDSVPLNEILSDSLVENRAYSKSFTVGGDAEVEASAVGRSSNTMYDDDSDDADFDDAGVEPPPVPHSLRTQLENPLGNLAAGDSGTTVGNKEEYEQKQLEDMDPIHWDTEHVIEWLRRYYPGGESSVDEDVVDAFRLSQASGDVLLNKVTPCDMFKEMRKWRRGKGAYKPEVTELMIQETVIQCFQYGGR